MLALVFGSSLGSAQPTLYERLGGRESLGPLVDGFVDMIYMDSSLQMNKSARVYLKSCKAAAIRAKLEAVACEATGGPCHAPQERAALRKSLRQMELTPTDWDKVLQDVSAALAKFGVAEQESKELRALVERVAR